MINKLNNWILANGVTLLLAIFGGGSALAHATYTLGRIQNQFVGVEERLKVLETTTAIIPTVNLRISNVEAARLDFVRKIDSLAEKQDLMDGKLNRILGFIDRNAAGIGLFK